MAVDYMNLPTDPEINPMYVTRTETGEPLTPEESLFIYYVVAGEAKGKAFIKSGMAERKFMSNKERDRGLSSADKSLLIDINKKEKEELVAANKKSPEEAEQEKEKSMFYSVLDKYPNIHITKDTDIKSLPAEVARQMYDAGIHASLTPRVNREVAMRIKKLQDKQIATTHEIYAYLTAVMRGQVKDQFGLDASLQERTRAAEALAKRIIDLPAKIEATKDIAQSGALQINIMPRTETIIDVTGEEK